MAFVPEYVKRNYVNGAPPPISADNLNAIETALGLIEEYLTTIEPITIERHVTTGTPIATITLGNVGYTLYANGGGGGGSSTEVGWNQIQVSGTKIAEITINDVPLSVYVPATPTWDDLANLTTFNIDATGWVANSDSSTNTDYPYIYTVTVSGMTASDAPICQLFGTGTVTTQAEMTDIALVQEIVSGTDTLTLYATELPTNDLVLQVIGD